MSKPPSVLRAAVVKFEKALWSPNYFTWPSPTSRTEEEAGVWESVRFGWFKPLWGQKHQTFARTISHGNPWVKWPDRIWYMIPSHHPSHGLFEKSMHRCIIWPVKSNRRTFGWYHDMMLPDYKVHYCIYLAQTAALHCSMSFFQLWMCGRHINLAIALCWHLDSSSRSNRRQPPVRPTSQLLGFCRRTWLLTREKKTLQGIFRG